MNHENIIGLLDVFHQGSENIENFQQVYLVTHLMGADLNNIIRLFYFTNPTNVIYTKIVLISYYL